MPPKDATPPNFAEKTSQIAIKPQNLQKVFSVESFPLYGGTAFSLFSEALNEGVYREKTFVIT